MKRGRLRAARIRPADQGGDRAADVATTAVAEHEDEITRGAREAAEVRALATDGGEQQRGEQQRDKPRPPRPSSTSVVGASSSMFDWSIHAGPISRAARKAMLEVSAASTRSRTSGSSVATCSPAVFRNARRSGGGRGSLRRWPVRSVDQALLERELALCRAPRFRQEGQTPGFIIIAVDHQGGPTAEQRGAGGPRMPSRRLCRRGRRGALRAPASFPRRSVRRGCAAAQRSGSQARAVTQSLSSYSRRGGQS